MGNLSAILILCAEGPTDLWHYCTSAVKSPPLASIFQKPLRMNFSNFAYTYLHLVSLYTRTLSLNNLVGASQGLQKCRIFGLFLPAVAAAVSVLESPLCNWFIPLPVSTSLVELDNHCLLLLHGHFVYSISDSCQRLCQQPSRSQIN